MRTIRIDDEVWKELQKQATPFEDTPNDVLRKVLRLGNKKSKRPSQIVGRTPQVTYRRAILEVLDEMEGSGQVREILDRVGEEMKDMLDQADYNELSSGMVRWRNTATWERQAMVKEGFLKSDSPHGYWEISDKGREYLQKELNMNFHQLKYLKYRIGVDIPHVLIDAVHATSPQADKFTGEIAREVTRKTSCHCIISTMSRIIADINRPRNSSNEAAIEEYRNAIREMLQSAEILNSHGTLKRPFLHLAIHGMRDRPDKDVEIGTRHGATCSASIRDWIVKRFCTWSQEHIEGRRPPIVVVDEELKGDISKTFHRHGDDTSGYLGYGPNFNTVQIEFSRWLREEHRSELIDFLSQLVLDFEKTDPSQWNGEPSFTDLELQVLRVLKASPHRLNLREIITRTNHPRDDVKSTICSLLGRGYIRQDRRDQVAWDHDEATFFTEFWRDQCEL